MSNSNQNSLESFRLYYEANETFAQARRAVKRRTERKTKNTRRR